MSFEELVNDLKQLDARRKTVKARRHSPTWAKPAPQRLNASRTFQAPLQKSHTIDQALKDIEALRRQLYGEADTRERKVAQAVVKTYETLMKNPTGDPLVAAKLDAFQPQVAAAKAYLGGNS